MHRPCLRKLRIVSVAIALIAGVIAATPVPAQTWGNLLGAIINQAFVDNAVKKWNAVDPDVRQCLINSYGLYANNLAQQGITPDDYRLQNQMQYCNQQVAQARYQQEQQEQQREAAISAAQTGWNNLAPAVRQCVVDRGVNTAQFVQQGIGPDQAPADGTVQSCQDQIAQVEAQNQKAEARHKDLVARFGSDEAQDIENDKVTVGMSKDAVREALGPPDRVDTIPPDDEMWVYGSERISISKGKVTYVGH